ncbi:MAG TPA: MFS transporter [Lacipirellulaceae bacterium]|jgi:predicted MFS family arabinose efflux permease|nr:MFS transporter [Lacipirellulaceae bacterium]
MNDNRSGSRRSVVGLNAANFFLAEITGVVMPFLGAFLKEREWGETAIGVTLAVAGLGVFLVQTPAGCIVDWVQSRRALLAGASVVLGVCYALVAVVPATPACIDPLLFTAGGAQAFFAPLLGALALALVGHEQLHRTMGSNQSWNHAGNLVSALLAIAIVGRFGLTSIFYAVGLVSVIAAASVFVIREDDLREDATSGKCAADEKTRTGIRQLLRDWRVRVLLVSTALFHLANAPVMPFLGAYIKKLDGSDVQVAMVVLVAQAVMIPVAIAAGILSERWGRKWVFAIGFIALPVRIFLYSLTQDPWILVALQALDGIGAGIYGVVIVVMCADLTRETGGFNTLSGMIATALAVGGVVGPIGAGRLAETLGYNGFFYVFAGIAAVAAAIFLVFMPETAPQRAK